MVDDNMQSDRAKSSDGTLYESSRHLLNSLYRRTRLMSSLVLPENIGPRISCISPCLLVASGSVPVTDIIDAEPPLTAMIWLRAYVKVMSESLRISCRSMQFLQQLYQHSFNLTEV